MCVYRRMVLINPRLCNVKRIYADLFVAHDENPHTRPVYVCLCLSYVWRCLSRGPNVTSVFEYFCVSPVKCLCVFIDEWCLSTLDEIQRKRISYFDFLPLNFVEANQILCTSAMAQGPS